MSSKKRITFDVTISDDDDPVSTELQKQSSEFAVVSLRKSLDDEQRVITCVAMVANEIDAHGDMFTAGAVMGACYGFTSNYNLSKSLGKQHDPEAEIDADLVGSFYFEEGATVSGLDVPPESWVVQIQINDDQTWDEVKKSTATGVSIQGPAEGYLTDANVEKSFDLSKAKAGQSEFTKPLRVFTKADPRNLDIVDEGANLHVLVWKAKKNNMADTPPTRETLAAEVVKGKPAEVIKSETPDLTTVVTELKDTVAELAKGFAIFTEAHAAAEPEAAKVEPEAETTAADGAIADGAIAAEIAKTLSGPLAELQAQNKKLEGELYELRKAKVAPSAAVDDVEPKPETEAASAELAKRFAANELDKAGAFAGVFGQLGG